jgi:AcrR family transcriptional regulator
MSSEGLRVVSGPMVLPNPSGAEVEVLESESGRSTRSNATRDRILGVARALFSERGYSGTSTRELAAAAEVTERTLFRHFPTKAELFESAVINPFHDFIADFVATWEVKPDKGSGTPYENALEFSRGLFDVLEENRALIVALMATQTVNDGRAADLMPDLRAGLSGLLNSLEQIMEVEAAKRGWQVNAHIVVRLWFGTVLSAATHADWLFPDGAVPDREVLLHELATFTVSGLSQQPKKATRSRK